MHPALPGEIHPLFGQPGAYHRQRVYPVRPVFCCMSAECQGDCGRNGKGEGADPERRSGGGEEKPWFNPPKEGPNFLKWNNSVTYLAITQDFKTYKKLGRITDSREDDRDVFIFPEAINGNYYRFSRPLYNYKDYGLDTPGILIAKSGDLMEWRNPIVFAKAVEPWEDLKIGGSCPPLKTDRGWLFIYHGVSSKDKLYRVGAMLLDLNDPTKILHRTKNPILEPKKEEGSMYSGCVFPTGNVIKDGILYVYYGINDKYVGLATADLNDFLDELEKE